MNNLEEKRPWVKSYRLGPYKLARSLKPYPEKPLFDMLDQSAIKHPRSTAIDYLGQRINYSELKKQTDSFSCALNKLGVKKSDKVATILPTCPQYIISNFAILKTGAVHVPCSIMHKENELEYEIGESGAETVICLAEQAHKLQAIKGNTKLKHIIVTSLSDYTLNEGELQTGNYNQHSFKNLIATHEPEPPAVAINASEDLAYLAFTGGATGSQGSNAYSLQPLFKCPAINGLGHVQPRKIYPRQSFHLYWGSAFSFIRGFSSTVRHLLGSAPDLDPGPARY